ncbi:site-specific recombinases DNA invertase Pin homologs [Clostridium sp. CAG:299]|nr:site-specific recombinases DNA invertase Pin homologs [Clostridium sp. CAG:299]
MLQKRLERYDTALYLRLSKEDGDVASGSKNESNSIANQKSLIMDYLQSRPEFRVVSIREDDGFSGTDFNRPAFQAMMEDVKKGVINCIIVKDLSRFGRNYIEVGRYLEKLFPMLGIRFIAVNDNYDSLEADTAHDIVVPFKNLINDSYCRDLSVKIRSHLTIKRKNGEFIGAFACYGYLKDKNNRNQLVVDTYAGQVVKDIFRMKINGMSQYRIADALNEQGILSPMEYKKYLGSHFESSFKVNPKAVWTAKAVTRILTNEVYTGVLVQGKQTTPNHKVKVRQEVDEADWIRVENAHESLIDRVLFDIVQNLMGRDTRTSPNETQVFPLSGLVYCGDCGHPMVRKISRYTKKEKADTAQTYGYFLCSEKCGKGGCSWHRISENDLMGAVLGAVNLHIQKVLDVQEALKQIENAPSRQLMIQKYQERLSIKEEERKKAERLKIGIYEDLKDGLLDKEEYQKLKAEFDSRIAEADSAVKELKRQIAGLEGSRSANAPWMIYFQQFGRLEQLTRWAAAIIIYKILVYEDNRIKITFNFEADLNRIQEILSAAEEHKKEAI